MHFVDEAMLTLGSHAGLRSIGLIGANVVVLQSVQHRLHARIDFGLFIAGAKPCQEKFQDESWYVRSLLDPM